MKLQFRFFALLLSLFIIVSLIMISLPVSGAAELRSSTGIVLSESAIDIDEHMGYMLKADINPTGKTITWTSSNPIVASVNIKGFVTARRAGTTTITASFVDDDGVTHSDSCIVYVTIPDGVYYLKNSGRYLALEDNSGVAGSDVLLSTKQTADPNRQMQFWCIRHLGGGRYVIRSFLNNVMGLCYRNSRVTIQSATMYDAASSVPQDCQWSIVYGNGGYNIRKNIVGTTALNKVSGGYSLGCSAYIETAPSRFNWSFERVCEPVDGRFVLTSVNYYDSSVAGNSAIIGHISGANAFAESVYSNYFGVDLYMDGFPSQFATVADDCTRAVNVSCLDSTCGSDCRLEHHKNIHSISDQLYNAPREYNHIYTLWANREEDTYCMEENGVHTELDSLALVCNKRPVIQFLAIYGYNEAQLVQMSVVLVHEMAHCFGMNDVYDTENHDVTGETICAMEYYDSQTADEFYWEVLYGNIDPFCDSCMQAMRQYTSTVNIPGN